METDNEKNLREKLPSFSSKNNNDNENNENQNESNEASNNPAESGEEEAKGDETDKKEEGEEVEEQMEDNEQVPDLGKVSEEIDNFMSILSSTTPPQKEEVGQGDEDHHKIPKIPDFLEQFAFVVEAKIANYDSFDTPERWSQLAEEDSAAFLQDVDRISKLFTSLSKFSSEAEYALSTNRIGGILQRAMSFMEEELRLILEDYKFMDPNQENKAKQTKQSDESEFSTDAAHQSTETADTAPQEPEPEPELENNFPGYSVEIISTLKKIVDALISGGHKTECCQVYFVERRKALEITLVQNLGFEKCSIDDVQKMNWESLERDIVIWVKTFKEFSNTILPNERKLIESVFWGHESVFEKMFGVLSQGVMIQLINFSEAVAMTKRYAEKLFKFLDVYETLRDLTPILDRLFPSDCVNDLKTEASMTRSRLGEAIICIFCELENSIKADTGKTPVAGGAVHPLARYIMNYLKYACEYKDTLEQVFKQHQKIERADSVSRHCYLDDPNNAGSHQNKDDAMQSPFQAQLSKVMDLLDTNLDTKSKLYKDTSLSLIFLMNNGRYILQKIKGSAEIKSILGETWCRKRSSDLRAHHNNYKRDTWGKLLQCLSYEGLVVNGKVVKPLLKEKFKSFNAMFDEIHKTQCTWIVSDEQLQSELRVSISGVVIPAYRSFMARFSGTFTPGRQTEKYIKYQPEDIETYIEELFDGTSASALGKKR